MPKTTAELVAAAYAEITVSADTASAADTAAITALVTPLLADLAGRRILVVADANAIPDAVFPDLTRVLAEHAAARFGRQLDPAKLTGFETRLRELSRLDKSTASTLAEMVLERLEGYGSAANAFDYTAVAAYIQPTLDDLTQRRVISLANEAAVTDKYKPHVVTLIASRVFPKAIDTAAVDAAEEALRRASRLDRTTDDVALAVLEQLEIYGQAQPAIDRTLVSNRLPGILADLAARTDVYYGEGQEDDIPDAAYADVIRYVAASLSNPPLYNIMTSSERRLRELAVVPGTGEVSRVEYF